MAMSAMSATGAMEAMEAMEMETWKIREDSGRISVIYVLNMFVTDHSDTD